MASFPTPSSCAPNRRNSATCIMPPGGLLAHLAGGLMSAREAWEAAIAVDRSRSRHSGPGFRLYWMTRNQFACRDLPAEPSAHVIVGRHTHCDAVLDADPTVALRHAIVRALVLDDGCPVLSVMDLSTQDGFELSDGTRERAIAATGPIVLRFGVYRLVALPSTGVTPEAFPNPICERALEHPYRIAARRMDSFPSFLPNRVSHITLLPRVTELGEQQYTAREKGDCELVLWNANGRAGVCLSRRDLARGILVGRSPRCLDSGLRTVLDHNISRVHVLLIRDRYGSYAYNVGSTQGVYQFGRPVRSVPLSEAGTSLTLCSANPLHLSWRAIA